MTVLARSWRTLAAEAVSYAASRADDLRQAIGPWEMLTDRQRALLKPRWTDADREMVLAFCNEARLADFAPDALTMARSSDTLGRLAYRGVVVLADDGEPVLTQRGWRIGQLFAEQAGRAGA